MMSVAGIATVAATPAAQQDGTNDGAGRCGRHWITCVMRTYLTLKRHAGLCSSIRGLREMTASHWFSIPNIRANSFSMNTPAAGYRRADSRALPPHLHCTPAAPRYTRALPCVFIDVLAT